MHRIRWKSSRNPTGQVSDERCKSNLDRGGFIDDIFVKYLKSSRHAIEKQLPPRSRRKLSNSISQRPRENVQIAEVNDETISVQGVKQAIVEDVFIKDVTAKTAPRSPWSIYRNTVVK